MAWLAAVAAVTSAVGAFNQGQAQANAAEYNAGVNDVNKGFALRDQAKNFARSQGRAMAGYGASGVTLDSGSPLDVLADAAAQSELDKLKIQFNYDSRSTLDRTSAENYRTSSVLNAVGSGLRSFGNAIPMFGGDPGTTTQDPLDNFYRRGNTGMAD